MLTTLLETQTNYQFFQKKNAPTLVLLHGWLQDWQCWSPVIGKLSEKYQLVIPDLPAFGKSTLGPDAAGNTMVWNSEQYARWLAVFIDSLSLSKTQPLVVLGHSFGGKIAAIATASYADSTTPPISGLVLVDSAGLPDPLSLTKKITQTMISAIPSFIKDTLAGPVKQTVLTTFKLSTDHLQSSPQQQKILEKIIRENISEYINKISVPSTLIWGAHDDATPIHQAKLFHIGLRNSTLHIFEKSDHFPFISQPTLFISTVSDFIDTL